MQLFQSPRFNNLLRGNTADSTHSRGMATYLEEAPEVEQVGVTRGELEISGSEHIYR